MSYTRTSTHKPFGQFIYKLNTANYITTIGNNFDLKIKIEIFKQQYNFQILIINQ